MRAQFEQVPTSNPNDVPPITPEDIEAAMNQYADSGTAGITGETTPPAPVDADPVQSADPAPEEPANIDTGAHEGPASFSTEFEPIPTDAEKKVDQENSNDPWKFVRLKKWFTGSK